MNARLLAACTIGGSGLLTNAADESAIVDAVKESPAQVEEASRVASPIVSKTATTSTEIREHGQARPGGPNAHPTERTSVQAVRKTTKITGSGPDATGSEEAPAENQSSRQTRSYRLLVKDKQQGGGDATVVDPRKASEYAEAIRRYEQELADLNAATQRRRDELMALMSATKAKQAAAELRKDREAMEAAQKLHRWIQKGTSSSESAQPDWVIGVALSADAEEEGLVVERVFEGKPAAEGRHPKGGLDSGMQRDRT